MTPRFADRLLPARPDIAARHLEGLVHAARFREGEARNVTVPLLDLAARPGARAERATQLLHGETFIIYASEGGYAWGQALEDGYVGYVRAEGLGPGETAATIGRVTAQRAHVYPEPSIKARPGVALPFMARLALAESGAETGGEFARLSRGGYVCAQHLAPVAGDFVAQAERFVGVPYLWGGRSPDGLDCSALVQLALMAVQVAAPRDSDMQAEMVGAPLDADAPSTRGDLVFWKSHVGIMADPGRIIHANAHHMAVTCEPFDMVARRIAASGGGPVTSRRRGADAAASWLPALLASSSRGLAAAGSAP